MATKGQKVTWKGIPQALEELVDLIAPTPGVLSMYAQYNQPLATVIVLVESDEAKRAVRTLELERFREFPDTPAELDIERVSPDELAEVQAALSTAFGVLWART